MKNKKLLIVGNTNIDYIIDVEEFPKNKSSALIKTCTKQYGGTGANMGMCASSLGVDTILISPVSDKFIGSDYYNRLENNGINLNYLNVFEDSQEPMAIMVNNMYDDTITYFNNGCSEELFNKTAPEIAISKAYVVHLTACNPMYAFRCSEEARKQGKIVSFEPGQAIDEYPQDILENILKKSDILFGNEYEISKICEKIDLNKNNLMKYLDVKYIIETCGERGSYIHKSNYLSYHIDSVYRPSVDPTGAGDSFKAGFWYAYLNGKSLNECMQYASTMASFIVEKQGSQTNIPTIEELEHRRYMNYDFKEIVNKEYIKYVEKMKKDYIL